MAATAGRKEPRRAVTSATKKWEGLSKLLVSLLKKLQLLWRNYSHYEQTSAIMMHVHNLKEDLSNKQSVRCGTFLWEELKFCKVVLAYNYSHFCCFYSKFALEQCS